MTASESKWSYQGETGPKHWGDLDKDYRICREGQRQSPIDLDEAIRDEDSNPLQVLDCTFHGTITDQRTTFRFVPDESPLTLRWREENFYLREFHFHTPSEHTVDGKRYPMETHFVHSDSKDDLLVLGLFHGKGHALQPWRSIRENAFGRNQDRFPLQFGELLPDLTSYFAYDGSLTTPPCSENVQWVIAESPVDVEQEWIDGFHERHGPNHRPLQPLHGRTIHRFTT